MIHRVGVEEGHWIEVGRFMMAMD